MQLPYLPKKELISVNMAQLNLLFLLDRFSRIVNDGVAWNLDPECGGITLDETVKD
jgi:hypothetical protein